MGPGWGRCGHSFLTVATALLGNLAAVRPAPCTCPTTGGVVDCGGSPHSAPLPSSGRVALGHDTLSCLLHGSFQGLWGLWVLLLSSSVLWDLAGAARAGLGFVEPLPPPQPAGPPAPVLLHHPGLCAPPGSLSQPAYHPGPLKPVGPGEPGAVRPESQLADPAGHSQAWGPLLSTLALAGWKLLRVAWPPCQA